MSLVRSGRRSLQSPQWNLRCGIARARARHTRTHTRGAGGPAATYFFSPGGRAVFEGSSSREDVRHFPRPVRLCAGTTSIGRATRRAARTRWTAILFLVRAEEFRSRRIIYGGLETPIENCSLLYVAASRFSDRRAGRTNCNFLSLFMRALWNWGARFLNYRAKGYYYGDNFVPMCVTRLCLERYI